MSDAPAVPFGELPVVNSITIKNVKYTMIREIGKGASSVVYAASTDNPITTPNKILKWIEVPDTDRRFPNINVFRAVMYREFMIAEYIRAKATIVCDNDVVCAQTFYAYKILRNNVGFYRAIYIFPYRDAQNLAVYMESVLFKLSSTNNDLYRRIALTLATKIISAVGKLHAIGIEHGDIKPENIIVAKHPAESDERLNLLFIDMAMSCTDRVRDFFSELNFDVIQCATADDGAGYMYIGSPLYRDPQSYVGSRPSDPEVYRTEQNNANKLKLKRELRIFPAEQAGFWAKKFDRYAAAATVQLLFDPEQALEEDAYEISIRATNYMPAFEGNSGSQGYVFDILSEMAAPDRFNTPETNHTSMLEYGFLFQMIADRLQKGSAKLPNIESTAKISTEFY